MSSLGHTGEMPSRTWVGGELRCVTWVSYSHTTRFPWSKMSLEECGWWGALGGMGVGMVLVIWAQLCPSVWSCPWCLAGSSRSSCWHIRAWLSWGILHKPHWGPREQINSLSIFLLAAGEVCCSDEIQGDNWAGLKPPQTDKAWEGGRKISLPPKPSWLLGRNPFLWQLAVSNCRSHLSPGTTVMTMVMMTQSS